MRATHCIAGFTNTTSLTSYGGVWRFRLAEERTATPASQRSLVVQCHHEVHSGRANGGDKALEG